MEALPVHLTLSLSARVNDMRAGETIVKAKAFQTSDGSSACPAGARLIGVSVVGASLATSPRLMQVCFVTGADEHAMNLHHPPSAGLTTASKDDKLDWFSLMSVNGWIPTCEQLLFDPKYQTPRASPVNLARVGLAFKLSTTPEWSADNASNTTRFHGEVLIRLVLVCYPGVPSSMSDPTTPGVSGHPTGWHPSQWTEEMMAAAAAAAAGAEGKGMGMKAGGGLTARLDGCFDVHASGKGSVVAKVSGGGSASSASSSTSPTSSSPSARPSTMVLHPASMPSGTTPSSYCAPGYLPTRMMAAAPPPPGMMQWTGGHYMSATPTSFRTS